MAYRIICVATDTEIIFKKTPNMCVGEENFTCA